VHAGQVAFVTTSTMPGKRYPGQVVLAEELVRDANVWQGGTPGKKVFGVVVSVGEPDPAHLRPGMTVDLEIVQGRIPQATMVPIRAVFKDHGGQFVWRARVSRRLRGEHFERVPVAVGARNDLLTEVHGGIRAGDRVALERPVQLPLGGREVKG
jgi:multidrug efflux pump subunit AcrA (membrane-fusion protein)